METLINNHNVNLGCSRNFFSKDLALQFPSLLNIPQEGFSTSFITTLISPLPSCGYFREVSKLKAKNGYLRGCITE